jgi:DNA-directed RNA polymerase subunit RPC12/RpoP
MGECAKCKKPYPEDELIWIEVPPEDRIQILWTGRGRDESKKKIMEVVCKGCRKKIIELDIW